MYHLKNLARTAGNRQQELTTLVKALPTAVLQSRGYAEHQIPDRLRDVPTAKDPRFFDMVEYFFHRGCQIAEDRLIDDMKTWKTCHGGQKEEGEGYIDAYATLRSHY